MGGGQLQLQAGGGGGGSYRRGDGYRRGVGGGGAVTVADGVGGGGGAVTDGGTVIKLTSPSLCSTFAPFTQLLRWLHTKEPGPSLHGASALLY